MKLPDECVKGLGGRARWQPVTAVRNLDVPAKCCLARVSLPSQVAPPLFSQKAEAQD